MIDKDVSDAYNASLDNLGKEIGLVDIGMDTRGVEPVTQYGSYLPNISPNSTAEEIEAMFDDQVADIPRRLSRFVEQNRPIFGQLPEFLNITKALPKFLGERLPQMVEKRSKLELLLKTHQKNPMLNALKKIGLSSGLAKAIIVRATIFINA